MRKLEKATVRPPMRPLVRPAPQERLRRRVAPPALRPQPVAPRAVTGPTSLATMKRTLSWCANQQYGHLFTPVPCSNARNDSAPMVHAFQEDEEQAEEQPRTLQEVCDANLT